MQNLLATQVTRPESDISADNDNDTLLQRYYTAWTEYSQGIEYLNYLYLWVLFHFVSVQCMSMADWHSTIFHFSFRYLNQQHIKRHRMTEAEFSYGSLSNEAQELMEIGELGLDIWRVCMIQSLGEEIVKQILDGIKADRMGLDCSMSNARVIRGIIQSFVQVQDYKKKGNLKLYQELFEAPMLEASGEYYKSEAAILLQRCTVSEYMEEVLKRLDDENRRAHKFFHGRWVACVSQR